MIIPAAIVYARQQAWNAAIEEWISKASDRHLMVRRVDSFVTTVERGQAFQVGQAMGVCVNGEHSMYFVVAAERMHNREVKVTLALTPHIPEGD